MKRLLGVIVLLVLQAKVVAAPDFDDKLAQIDTLRHSNMQQAVSQVNDLESGFENMSSTQQSRFLVLKAFTLIYAAKYDEAISVLLQAESLVDDLHSLMKIYNYQATALLFLHQYEEALSVIAKGLSLIEQISEVDDKRLAYLRLANLYSAMGFHGIAATYSTKVLNLASPADSGDICGARILITVNAMEQQQASAYDDFKATADYCQLNNLPLLATIATKGMGEAKFRLGEYQAAIPLLLEALTSYQAFNFQSEISDVNTLLAQNYLEIGELSKATQYAQLVIAQVDMPSNQEHKQLAYQILAKLAASEGQFERAYAYSLLQQHYKQLVLDETKIKALAYQASKYNSEEKEREITLLNKERELYMAQQLVKEREYTNMLMFVTMLVGGVFFLGILVVFGVLQKRKYMYLAKMDGLTGIYNRSAGQNMGEEAFIHILTRNGDFALVLFDLDYFKQINDNYGHGTGDWALKKVVDVVKENIRPDDIFARFGGEEFAIMMPFCDVNKAKAIADVCRERIAAIDTRYSGHEFVLTASFGVTALTEADLSLDPLFSRADAAQYAAKHAGRNRVVVHGAPEPLQSLAPAEVQLV